MFEEFLDVIYEKTSRQQATFEVIGLLDGLPDWEVEKIASGMPIAELYGHLDRKPLTKTASDCGPDGEPKSFLDRFKGTPLFDQAVALEQEELQAEMLDLQKKQESRANRQNEDTIWDAKDKLRVRKRLLELELAKQQGGAPAAVPAAEPMGDTTQGAGAPGPVPAEGVQDSSGGLGGGVAKVGFAVTEKGHKYDAAHNDLKSRHMAEERALSDHFTGGRFGITDEAKKHIQEHGGPKTQSLLSLLRFGTAEDLAGRHHEYVAGKHHKGENAYNPLGGLLTPTKHETGGTSGFFGSYGASNAHPKEQKKHAEDAQHLAMADRMGRILARSEKTAFDMKAVGGMATKALGAAKANPALAGAAVGAVGGALAGGPDNRLGGALGGAALGGAAGHAAHGISGHMAGGASFGDAAKAYGGGLAQKARSMGGGTHASPSVLGRSSPTPAAQVSLAPPNPMDFAVKDWRGRPKVGSKE